MHRLQTLQHLWVPIRGQRQGATDNGQELRNALQKQRNSIKSIREAPSATVTRRRRRRNKSLTPIQRTKSLKQKCVGGSCRETSDLFTRFECKERALVFLSLKPHTPQTTASVIRSLIAVVVVVVVIIHDNTLFTFRRQYHQNMWSWT